MRRFAARALLLMFIAALFIALWWTYPVRTVAECKLSDVPRYCVD